ncbi:MAG: hypothetical protein RBU37_16325 [Myxococcota bacterium]|nr:hypothetical protein [Myxococcota bacterium]
MSSIDLERRFVELSPGDRQWEFALLLRPASDELTWTHLCELPCAVVLGEAGTGKTTEFQRQRAALQAQGHAAFFFSLTELGDQTVRGHRR